MWWLAAASVFASTGIVDIQTGWIAGDQVHLRSGPGKEHPIADVLAWRTPVRLGESNGSFRAVSIPNTTVSGYVHRSLLTTRAPATVDSQRPWLCPCADPAQLSDEEKVRALGYCYTPQWDEYCPSLRGGEENADGLQMGDLERRTPKGVSDRLAVYTAMFAPERSYRLSSDAAIQAGPWFSDATAEPDGRPYAAHQPSGEFADIFASSELRDRKPGPKDVWMHRVKVDDGGLVVATDAFGLGDRGFPPAAISWDSGVVRIEAQVSMTLFQPCDGRFVPLEHVKTTYQPARGTMHYAIPSTVRADLQRCLVALGKRWERWPENPEQSSGRFDPAFVVLDGSPDRRWSSALRGSMSSREIPVKRSYHRGKALEYTDHTNVYVRSLDFEDCAWISLQVLQLRVDGQWWRLSSAVNDRSCGC